MSYLCKLYIVIEDDLEKPIYQNILDRKLEEAFNNYPHINIVGSKVCELDNRNCGKCCKCGSWVSDQDLVDNIDGFSDGCLINGEWWCDLCIPPDHPKSF